MPEFDAPPVSEVAISLEFTPLEHWSPSLALQFGKLIQNDYPLMEIQPPLFGEQEKFGDEFWQPSQPRVEMLTQNDNRFWFTSRSSDWLIQLQHDRFVLNWRKRDEPYPRYELVIRQRFLDELDRFAQFLNENGLGEIFPVQCEVTYVNDLPKEDYWGDVGDAMSLFSHFSQPNFDFLPDIESFNFTGSYQMPEHQGRLRFSIVHALRNIDRKEVLKVTLVARGRPMGPDRDLVVQWFDMGREWIVRGFTDLTSGKAHELWRRAR